MWTIKFRDDSPASSLLDKVALRLECFLSDDVGGENLGNGPNLPVVLVVKLGVGDALFWPVNDG